MISSRPRGRPDGPSLDVVPHGDVRFAHGPKLHPDARGDFLEGACGVVVQDGNPPGVPHHVALGKIQPAVEGEGGVPGIFPVVRAAVAVEEAEAFRDLEAAVFVAEDVDPVSFTRRVAFQGQEIGVGGGIELDGGMEPVLRLREAVVASEKALLILFFMVLGYPPPPLRWKRKERSFPCEADTRPP